MTIVYYVVDGDDILVSTMAARAKAKAVARNQKVSLCVLDEQWPPTYLQVYCDAKVETDHGGFGEPQGREGAVHELGLRRDTEVGVEGAVGFAVAEQVDREGRAVGEGDLGRHVAHHDVKGEPGQLSDAIARADSECLALPFEKVTQSFVAPEHTFWKTRRTGGEE